MANYYALTSEARLLLRGGRRIGSISFGGPPTGEWQWAKDSFSARVLAIVTVEKRAAVYIPCNLRNTGSEKGVIVYYVDDSLFQETWTHSLAPRRRMGHNQVANMRSIENLNSAGSELGVSRAN